MPVLDPNNPIPEQIMNAAEMVRLVAEGNFTCCAISGGAGIGKTFLTLKVLNQLQVDYEIARGTGSGLLQTAYNLRKGGVAILDDADNLVRAGGDTQANLMKQLLAPERERTIVHRTDKSLKNLRKSAPDTTMPPPNFRIKCGFVWLTNIPFDLATMPSDIEPHIRPLVDRGMHPICISQEPQHILNYIMHLVYDQRIKLGGKQSLSLAETNEVMHYFVRHAWHFRSLSIRTLFDVATMRKATPRWEAMLQSRLMPEQRYGCGRLPDIPTLMAPEPKKAAGEPAKGVQKSSVGQAASEMISSATIPAAPTPEASRSKMISVPRKGQRRIHGSLPEVPTALPR